MKIVSFIQIPFGMYVDTVGWPHRQSYGNVEWAVARPSFYNFTLILLLPGLKTLAHKLFSTIWPAQPAQQWVSRSATKDGISLCARAW